MENSDVNCIKKEEYIEVLQATNKDGRRIKCAYCDDNTHLSSEFFKASNIKERKEILRKNKFCYNCTSLLAEVQAAEDVTSVLIHQIQEVTSPQRSISLWCFSQRSLNDCFHAGSVLQPFLQN